MTGGAGYVGSVSAEAFLAAGHDVVVLDDLTTGHRAAVPADATLHARHLRRRGRRLARLLEAERIEAILHCAARSLVGESIAEPAKYYRDNVAGGVALLEAARAAGVDRIVFSSTRRGLRRPGRRRRSPRTPRSARSTRTASRSGRSRARCAGTAGPTACAASASATSTSPARPRRSARTTTPRRTSSRTCCRPPRARQTLTVFGDDYPTPDGTCIRDYIHVADLADAHLRAIEATAPGDPRTDDAARLQPRHRRRVLDPRGPRRRRARRRPPDPVRRRAAPRGRSAGPRGERRTGARGPRLAAGPADPRGDGRVGLGVAPAPPGRLPGLTGTGWTKNDAAARAWDDRSP